MKVRYPSAELLRHGDPAFIMDRTEALALQAEEPELYVPPNVQEFYLCDGVLLWGDSSENVFYDGENSRATWFEAERRLNRRPIIYTEEQ